MKKNVKKNQLQHNLASPATKGDLENMGAYIVGAIAKTPEEYPTKEDLKDVSGLRRRVRDLEADTITRREFNDFKGKVLPQ